MKVLVLSHISELLGGAERSMLDVIGYLSNKYSIEPEFILREPIKSLATEIKAKGWKYHAVDYTFWSDSNPPTEVDDIIKNSERNRLAVEKICKIIKKVKPDIVMTNSVVCPWAALASYYEKVPHIWFVREYGDLDHGRIYEIGRQKTLQDVGNLSQLVVTISQALYKHLSKYISEDKLTILYNPFDLNSIKQKAKAEVKNPFKEKDGLKLVISGNFARSKGQLEAIKATHILNKKGYTSELCIIGREGDKDYMDEVHSYIIDNRLQDKIHTVGYKENPLAYVSLADVGIMPSRMEGFGRVTFEYMVAGKAVVGANSGATPEMVEDGLNGYLFDPSDTNSLVNAVVHYAKNKNLIAKHGKASARKAEQMMSGQHNIDNLYKKIVEVHNNHDETHSKNINYIEHMKKQQIVAMQRLKQQKISFKRRAYKKLYHTAKRVYVKGRNIKTRMVGK